MRKRTPYQKKLKVQTWNTHLGADATVFVRAGDSLTGGSAKGLAYQDPVTGEPLVRVRGLGVIPLDAVETAYPKAADLFDPAIEIDLDARQPVRPA